MGFVFQRYHLLPALTALDNVIAPVLPFKVGGSTSGPGARELLDAVGLAGREKSLPAQLSGGQQQRVAIARSLIGAPRGCCWPTSRPATSTRPNGGQILDLLHELREERGMTVLLATHEQHIAARCDRLIRLRDGKIIDDLDLTGGESAELTLARVARLRQ